MQTRTLLLCLNTCSSERLQAQTEGKDEPELWEVGEGGGGGGGGQVMLVFTEGLNGEPGIKHCE